MITGENLSLNYLTKLLYFEFVNIFGVPYLTSPVNISI